MTTARKSQRFPAYRFGHIVLDGGNKLIKCSIRDLSDKGAALVVDGDAGIPRRFDLLFQAEELVHPTSDAFLPKLEKKMVIRACEVAWSNGERIGVSFT
jgi:hypothetical protein